MLTPIYLLRLIHTSADSADELERDEKEEIESHLCSWSM